ncbi:MAG TPA: FAD-dependent oxidoreductase [Planctomycetota bacterium]|nr:FAD-dependent oxidoreductase [Planctomycetota bacterium]
MRVAVLGAGISGLATARFLQEGGADVHLLEAAEEVGGLCRSASVRGFTYDLAGGHILFSKEKWIREFVVEALGGPEAVVATERNTKILLGDRFVHYPFENGLGDLPPALNAACLRGYVEAHLKRRRGAPPPANFRDWIVWKFGEGIARAFMVPYNEKLWKRDLGEITSRWVEGRVPDAPLADVLKGSVGLKTEGYTHQIHFHYPRRGGFGSIPRAVGAPVLDRVRLRTPVDRVERAGGDFLVNGERFEAVVNTLPLMELARACPGLSPTARDAIGRLQWNSLTTVLVGLRRPDAPPYSWVYLPEPEHGPTNRITFFSNYSPENAPPGHTSILAEVTHAGPPPEDPDLVPAVLRGLERAGILRPADVLLTATSTVPYAYIVFDHGFEENLAAALEGVRALGLHTVGRFGRFEYVNSDQCIQRARALADEILGLRRA